jgi:CheY-like chemotaxis protein
VLIAASSLLERGDQALDPGVRSALEMIRRNVELESRLVDDLLDVSRIARGRLTLDLEAVDVHRVIRDCVEICRDEIFLAGLKVVSDLAAREYHVTGDHARLMQVVWNLIRNAARFTPGGGTLTIRTSNAPDPGLGRNDPDLTPTLIVEFADTGIGVDKSILARIFDAFYQGDADLRQRSGGLGLGLAISRSITEAHGGRLSADSPGPGQGSTFRLELRTVAAKGTPPEPIRPSTSPPGSPGLNVLLVEDNKDTRQYLMLVLEQLNHKVVPVDRVSAAMAAASETSFDLLISDIELPDGTGLELMYGLGGGRSLPGIAMSGFGSEEDLQNSARAGFSEHLTKPVDLDRLESAIRRATSRSATGPHHM